MEKVDFFDKKHLTNGIFWCNIYTGSGKEVTMIQKSLLSENVPEFQIINFDYFFSFLFPFFFLFLLTDSAGGSPCAVCLFICSMRRSKQFFLK